MFVMSLLVNCCVMASSSSRASQNRLRRYNEILRHKHPAAFPCDSCLSDNECCFVMPAAPDKSCAHCARRGRPCVTTSWASLDRSRDDLETKISQDERAREQLLEHLNQLQMRLVRNRKLKEKKESEAAEKLRCLEAEMVADGEEIHRSEQDPLSTEECLASWGVQSPFRWFNPISGEMVENMPLSGCPSLGPLESLVPGFSGDDTAGSAPVS
jgi:hypothetical protein